MKSLAEMLLETTMKVVKTVAKLMPDVDPDPLITANKFIGKPYPRVDGRLKVTGQARYAVEHPLDNMTYAALVHSAIAVGKITKLDSEAAEAVPGVLRVMTYRNAPPMKTPTEAYGASKTNPLTGSTTTLPVMQSDEIFWNGQAVAVVVAETPELASYAASLIRVTYEAKTPALSLHAEKGAAFTPDNVVFEPSEISAGNAAANLLTAPVSIDETYFTPVENHNALEPHACIAAWSADGKLLVYDSAQYPSGVKEALMDMFGLKPEQVRVITEFVGGAFGGKVAMWSHVPLAAAAARLTGRPVKLALTRAGVNYMVGGRSMIEQRVALGATRDGQLTSLIHTGYSMCTKDVYAEQFSFPARHMYAAPNFAIWQKVVRLDRAQNTYMRAPGETPGMYALESAMDELAHKLGMDPVALRLLNEPEKDPTAGTDFSTRHLREAYALGAEKFGWDTHRRNAGGAADRPPEPGTVRRGDWLIGTGMASSYYPSLQLPVTIKTRITVDGAVAVRTASIEMGVGLATIQTQHIAERFGVPFDKAHYGQGNSDLPVSRAMGGSSATVSIGSAIQASAALLIDELLKLTHANKDSPLRTAKTDEVALRNGGLYRNDQPGTGESYGAILSVADKLFVEVEASSANPNMKYSMGSYGAHFCEVRVHAHTRQVQVKRFVSAYDCGRIMNVKTASSQIKGGIVMGIGMALMEESVFDARTGRLMNPTLGEYHVPVNADVPPIEVHFLDYPDPLMPMGAKSVGEVGITGVAAAVANAVFQATGIRVRDLPITVDKLL